MDYMVEDLWNEAVQCGMSRPVDYVLQEVAKVGGIDAQIDAEQQLVKAGLVPEWDWKGY